MLIQKYREIDYVLLPLTTPYFFLQQVVTLSQVMNLKNPSGKHKYQKNPGVSKNSKDFFFFFF